MSKPPKNTPKDDDDNEEESTQKMDRTQGQAMKDMQKVTGYVEDVQEGQDVAKINEAMQKLLETKKAAATRKAARKQLDKIPVASEDVALVMSELEIPKSQADRLLRESNGDLKATLLKFLQG